MSAPAPSISSEVSAEIGSPGSENMDTTMTAGRFQIHLVRRTYSAPVVPNSSRTSLPSRTSFRPLVSPGSETGCQLGKGAQTIEISVIGKTLQTSKRGTK